MEIILLVSYLEFITYIENHEKQYELTHSHTQNQMRRSQKMIAQNDNEMTLTHHDAQQTNNPISISQLVPVRNVYTQQHFVKLPSLLVLVH